MNHPFILPFRRFQRRLLSAMLICAAAIQANATPVFETVQGFVQLPSIPESKVIQGSDGNFYGTTYYGGNGNGTVFRLTPAGTLTNLVNFTGANGSNPEAGLIQASDGNFYGTTPSGGTSGYGTVFKMTASGTLTTLVNFTSANGGGSYAGLIQGSDGDFYGSTLRGGSSNYGTIFKMTSSGTLTTLVNFTGTNGSDPYAGLLQGNDGNFYGTTYGGGSGKGTVFQMSPSGTLTTLVNFTGANGENPIGGLIQDSDGNLYGSTLRGGSSSYGTIFKTTTSGTLTTLVNFTETNGSNPHADLILGGDGNFYGSTSNGGTDSYGTVFKMTPTGMLTTLVNFNYTNGSNPLAGLIQGSDGNLFGTTYLGGSRGCGTVFQLTPEGAMTILVNFPNADNANSNGVAPLASLIQGNDGNFYGTTLQGGSVGYGTVFQMTPEGAVTTLADFSGINGSDPRSSLLQGRNGNFYGTTFQRGTSGHGTVYQLTPEGTLTTLVNFSGANGGRPYANLIEGNDGDFYGTTSAGGPGVSGPFQGNGTVFKMTPSGELTTLVNFDNTNGSRPYGDLIQGSDGSFYGTTNQGGNNNSGTVFRMTLDGTVTTLVNFDNSNGRNPYAGLIQGGDGNFYGTTEHGGSSGYGTVFKMTPVGDLTTLMNFNNSNGRYPDAELIQGSDGNFYGTTSEGGSNDYGTIFKMTASGTLTTLVNFTGTNGQWSYAGLIRASDGHLYGITSGGGTTSDGHPAGGGQIFRLRMGPTVASQSQTNVTSISATLNGTVNPGGYATPVSFQYGMDPALASFGTASAGSLAAGTTDTPAQASISGLQPGKTYYYRVQASNIENTVPQYGEILSFTTPVVPDIKVTTGPNDPYESSYGSGGAIGFPRTTPGATEEIPLYLRNAGGAVLNGISVTITGPDANQFIVPDQPETEIYPGTAGTSFLIRFSPSSVGIKTATLTINSNDPDENPISIDLHGLGNTLPTFAGYSATTPGVPITLSFAKLMAKAHDADGEALTLDIASPSPKGATITRQATGFLYTPAPGFVGADDFQIYVQDPHEGIDGLAIGTVTITVTAAADAGGGTTLNPPILTMNPDGTAGISFQGIPGRTYLIQRTANMAGWITLATLAADASGNISYTDPSPPSGSAFYRLGKP